MQPASVPLCLTPGTTNRSVLRVMQPQFVYRAVAAIEATAPVTLNVPGHGIDTGSWHCWLTGVQRMPELNREPLRQLPHRVTVMDADTLVINRISATGTTAAGGELVYQPPVDLTGCDVELKAFDKPGGSELLSMVLGSGLEITEPGTIELEIGPAADFPAAAKWYWIEVRFPDGSEYRYWQGEVKQGSA